MKASLRFKTKEIKLSFRIQNFPEAHQRLMILKLQNELFKCELSIADGAVFIFIEITTFYKQALRRTGAPQDYRSCQDVGMKMR